MKRGILALSLISYAMVAHAGESAETGVNHERYARTVFDEMPHALILKLQKQKCRDNAIAAGNEQQEHVCIEELDKAYERLGKANQLRQIPDTTWRLCLGQAQDGTSYDYRVWAKCLAVAISICKMTEAGNYVDKPACMRMIESGAWVANSKAR